MRSLPLLLCASLLVAGCSARGTEAQRRSRMVEHQIAARGVRDPAVLAAMGRVPRHEFVLESDREFAYDDRPLSIGFGQTISQPYVVAVMSELAQLEPGDRVLEVGTGSGYQAAILAALGADVYSIELLPELAARAAKTLVRLGYDGVRVRRGDGYAGWPSAAPFQAVIVTAAPPSVPPRLLDQLAIGGRLVIPVGSAYQELQVHVKREDGVHVQSIFPVRFVPMLPGEEGAGAPPPPK